MMKTLKKALKIFLDEAYQDTDVPEAVASLADSVSSVNNFSELLEVQGVESPTEGVASIRLGNRLYPHMKLVVREEEGELHFAVDTHDGPDRIPPSLPGYERFKPIIRENEKIRQMVQARLAKEFFKEEKGERPGDFLGNILVVDDESFVRDILSRLLSSFGFEVVSAKSADEGIARAMEKKIACCFLDIMMPGKSGYQFIEELEGKGLRKFPIVFLTGMNPDHIRDDVADGLILKPFTASMLKERLSDFGLL